eukprot:320768_1
MASKKGERFGLLTFAHGTFYGLQLLQHEVATNYASNTNKKLDKGVTYNNLQDTDIDNTQNDNTGNKPTATKIYLTTACKTCNCLLLCKYCPSFRPFIFALIGLLQITPQAVMIFFQQQVYTLTIISFVTYLIITLTAIYYYFKFIYYFAVLKEYKFTLLDDITFPELCSDEIDEIITDPEFFDCPDSVPLVVKNTNNTIENKSESDIKTLQLKEPAILDIMNDNSSSFIYRNSTFVQITPKHSEQYSNKFFCSLLWFMGMLLLMNINIGIFTFVDVLFYYHDNNIVASIIFIIFSYPFIATNMVFIELQLMNELLHKTPLENVEHHNLLSSKSSFWYLYGFALNHYPILYFLLKTATYSAVMINIFAMLLSEFYGMAELDKSHEGRWTSEVFNQASMICNIIIFWYEPAFVNVLLNGYHNLYPPIHNPNIDNVTPPDKPCPNHTLEQIKIILIKIIDFLTPYSWIIECTLTAINAIILLFYFTIWDRYVSTQSQYDYKSSQGAGIPFIVIASCQIIVIIYAILGEKCCYSIGEECFCTNKCFYRKQCCPCDCFCRCVRCCDCAPQYWYCWCCCAPPCCCCTPKFALSPDYKLRFLTFLESMSLFLKLLHYYNFSTINNNWYDIVFQILIFLSLTTLFLLGFAGAFRSIHGLEIQSIMKSSKLFTLCYLLGFAFTQIVVYGNFIFTMAYYDIDKINNNDRHYQWLIFMIFIWIIISNVYTKEYRAFTKAIERDWFKYMGIKLIGYHKEHALPSMIGSLFHLLQLIIVFSSTVVIYYIIDLAIIDQNSPNWMFEKHVSITNLILTFIILIISTIAIWAMSLSTETLNKMQNKKNKKAMIARAPTIYHNFPTN